MVSSWIGIIGINDTETVTVAYVERQFSSRIMKNINKHVFIPFSCFAD